MGAKTEGVDRAVLRSRCLAAVAAALCAAAPAWAFRAAEEGKPAPEFAVKSTGGATVSLGEQKGKAVVLVVVRQGQEKSAEALKDLGAVAPDLAAKSAVLAVVANPGDGDAAQWASGLGVKFPVLLDGGGEFYGQYGVVVVPSTGVLGPDGVFRGDVSGHTASYRATVEGLLKVALGLATAEEAKSQAEAVGGPAKSEERKAAERHLEKARLLVKRKMADKALASAREAVSADAAYAEAQAFLGEQLLDASESNAEEAKGHFEKAVALEPRLAEAQIGLARVKSIQGDADGAAALLVEAARLNPKPERVYYRLGLVYERGGKYEKAVEAYRKALEKLLD
ncbi:MAG: peroxiredoxin family protein [Deferrisomatales bacterium]